MSRNDDDSSILLNDIMARLRSLEEWRARVDGIVQGLTYGATDDAAGVDDALSQIDLDSPDVLDQLDRNLDSFVRIGERLGKLMQSRRKAAGRSKKDDRSGTGGSGA